MLMSMFGLQAKPRSATMVATQEEQDAFFEQLAEISIVDTDEYVPRFNPAAPAFKPAQQSSG